MDTATPQFLTTERQEASIKFWNDVADYLNRIDKCMTLVNAPRHEIEKMKDEIYAFAYAYFIRFTVKPPLHISTQLP